MARKNNLDSQESKNNDTQDKEKVFIYKKAILATIKMVLYLLMIVYAFSLVYGDFAFLQKMPLMVQIFPMILMAGCYMFIEVLENN